MLNIRRSVVLIQRLVSSLSVGGRPVCRSAKYKTMCNNLVLNITYGTIIVWCATVLTAGGEKKRLFNPLAPELDI